MKDKNLVKFVTSIILGSILIFTLIPEVNANPPSGTWVSGIACQNLDTNNDAAIQLQFFQENDPSPVLTYNDSILKGANKNYYTPSSPSGIPNGFTGSVVVSSSTEISCNVNTITTGTGTSTNPIRLGISSGFNDKQIGPIAYLPQIENGYYGWNSYFSVQNPNNSPVNITITYKDRSGNDIPAAQQTATIPAQTNKLFYSSDNANLPSNFIGAAKVASDDGVSNLAVISSFYNAGTDNTTAQISTYNGLSSGAQKLYAPYILRNYYGYNSGLAIQNVGDTATTVKITMKFGTTDYIYNSPSILPGAALALYTPNISELAPVDNLANNLRYGSAIIEAATGGSVVAIVNEVNWGGSGIPVERAGQAGTYNAFLDGQQTNTVFLPQIPRNAGGIWSGGFQINNTTDVDATCTITYAGVPAATETSVALPKNGFFSRYGPSVANLPDGFNSSVTITCTQPIVGIANQAINPGSGKLGDTFGQSNGLNQ